MSATNKPFVDTTDGFSEFQVELAQPLPKADLIHLLQPVVRKEKKKKKKKKKKKEKQPKNKILGQVGSARGIETLFRNSYRAQLDLIALATTKANMMISINGFIVSFLVVSQPFVMKSNTVMAIPLVMFLLTCLGSMLFAILGALPRREKSALTLLDFETGKANLLIFEQFSNLCEYDYLIGIRHLLHDQPRIYDSMTGQLYMLGLEADRKFKRIHISYMVFLIGISLSITLLLAAITAQLMGMSPVGIV